MAVSVSPKPGPKEGITASRKLDSVSVLHPGPSLPSWFFSISVWRWMPRLTQVHAAAVAAAAAQAAARDPHVAPHHAYRGNFTSQLAPFSATKTDTSPNGLNFTSAKVSNISSYTIITQPRTITSAFFHHILPLVLSH
jgi:hypothetical protein